MSTKESVNECKNCIYWKRSVSFWEDRKEELRPINRLEGECHRYPPTAIGFVIKASLVKETTEIKFSFSTTQEDEYCGEFKNE